MDNSRGEYIVFIDDDDWLLSNSYIDEILDFIKDSKYPVIRFKYENDSTDTWYWSMVWEYVYKADFIKHFRFDNTLGREDISFNNSVFGRLGFDNKDWNDIREKDFVPYFEKGLYYYNFPREGSVVDLLNKNN